MRTSIASLTSIALALTLGTGCKPQVEPEPPAPAPAPEPEPEPEPEPVADRVYPDPPPPTAAKSVDFPAAAEFTLDNGLVVYVVENHEVPVVSSTLVVRAGSMDDPIVADLTAVMLGEGTKARSKAKIDEAIEFVGGVLGESSSTHNSFVYTRTLAKDLKLGLTLLSDEIMSPLFPEEALAKTKNRVKTGLSMQAGDPGHLADTLFNMVAYPDGHPYGTPDPTPEEVDAVTVADLQDFHETFYRANNSYLVLSGDITPETAKPLVERTLGRWKSTTKRRLPGNPLNKFKDYAVPSELVVHLVDRPGSAQAEIMIGNLALARNHKDWPALQVANAILGGSATGRLFLDIREERGLAYNVGSSLEEGQAPGTFYISTRTRNASTGEMLAGLFDHLGRMRKELPTEAEVEGAKARIVGQFPLELETAEQIAAKVRAAITWGLPDDYWTGYRDSIASITAEQVRDAAKKYMHPIPHVVIVGESAAIESQIKEVLPKATIKSYGTDLQPKG
jgi:zinc protease